MNSTARRMFELVEPIGLLAYAPYEPDEAMFVPGRAPPSPEAAISAPYDGRPAYAAQRTAPTPL